MSDKEILNNLFKLRLGKGLIPVMLFNSQTGTREEFSREEFIFETEFGKIDFTFDKDEKLISMIGWGE